MLTQAVVPGLRQIEVDVLTLVRYGESFVPHLPFMKRSTPINPNDNEAKEQIGPDKQPSTLKDPPLPSSRVISNLPANKIEMIYPFFRCCVVAGMGYTLFKSGSSMFKAVIHLYHCSSSIAVFLIFCTIYSLALRNEKKIEENGNISFNRESVLEYFTAMANPLKEYILRGILNEYPQAGPAMNALGLTPKKKDNLPKNPTDDLPEEL